MKRALLKLISVFQIVAGLAGIHAVVLSVVGLAIPEIAPLLWYGVFPLLSVIAGVLLWRLEVRVRTFRSGPTASSANSSGLIC
jgi:hypothetical protein